MKTFQTIEDDLGVVYAKPTNHRLDSDGRIVADYTIIDAPNDLKSEIGKDTLMSLGMKRGLTDSSGRRTIKLSSDNLYRGFILSMAENPDKQDEYKEEWENARAVGNSDEYRLKGKGQQGLIKYLVEKNLISDKVLNDSKMGKVFKNALQEVFDIELNQYVLKEEE